jgi:hypothetical protein
MPTDARMDATQDSSQRPGRKSGTTTSTSVTMDGSLGVSFARTSLRVCEERAP